MDIDDLRAQFSDPGREYRVAPLLRINDDVDPAHLESQIATLREAGFGGIYLCCERFADGAPHPFVSPWWREVVQLAARLCARYGLSFNVYDDEDWPSGSIGGQLIERDPDAQWRYLDHEEHAVAAGRSVSLAVPEGTLVAAVAMATSGRRLVADTAVELTDHVQDGVLSWTAPQDSDHVVTFCVARRGTGIFTDGYGDLMDRRTVSEFIDWSYDWHVRAVAAVPGAQIGGFFTDEPAFSLSMVEWGDRFHWYPAMPYTPDLGAAFQQLHGYRMEPMLPLLYRDAAPDALRFRCHYWAACCHLYSNSYFRQIYDYCESRGLESSGHLVREEYFQSHLGQQAGNLITHFRHMHVPGCDWIAPFGIFEDLPSTTLKYPTSMAHLMGRDRTWCESFAGAGHGTTFQQLRRIANWQHVNGINMQIPITYSYSYRRRPDFYPGGPTYQQPYWDHIRAFSDYEARVSLLTAGCEHRAQVALAYPSVDIWANAWNHGLLDERGAGFNELGDSLRRAGYDYDVLDDEALLDACGISDGQLVSATERFDVLVLPKTNAVRRATIERARDLARAGGTVVIVGRLPQDSYESGSDDPHLAAVLRELVGRDPATVEFSSFRRRLGDGDVIYSHSTSQALALLSETVTPDLIVLDGSREIYGWHRSIGADADLFHIFNNSDEERCVMLSLGAEGYPEHWNPETGKIESIPEFSAATGRTEIRVMLSPRQLMPVVLRAMAEPGSQVRATRVDATHELEGPWTFAVERTMAREDVAWNFQPERWGFTASPVLEAPPDQIQLGDWSAQGLPHFSGIGIYRCTFDLPERPADSRLELDLGEVAVSAAVLVNGRSAGTVVFAPWRVDITDLVHPGTNDLTVRVANTLSNYFSQFPELRDRPLETGGDFPERRVSGLIGPVTLRSLVAHCGGGSPRSFRGSRRRG